MENKKSKTAEAVENFAGAHNCAQAVFCAFCEDFGIDKKTGFKLSEALGGGMIGTHENICGALSAAYLIASLKNSDATGKTKFDTYALAQRINDEFEKSAGSIICSELKGLKTGKMLCSCPDCVKKAAEILEKYI